MDLTDVFRIFHTNAEEYTFFSSTHGSSSMIGHILGQKSSLSKFKKTEIVWGSAKAVLRGKFIAIKPYLKK